MKQSKQRTMQDEKNSAYWKSLEELSIREYFERRKALKLDELTIAKNYLIFGTRFQFEEHPSPNYEKRRLYLDIFDEERKNRLEAVLFSPENNQEAIQKIISTKDRRIIIGVTSGLQALPILRYSQGIIIKN